VYQQNEIQTINLLYTNVFLLFILSNIFLQSRHYCHYVYSTMNCTVPCYKHSKGIYSYLSVLCGQWVPHNRKVHLKLLAHTPFSYRSRTNGGTNIPSLLLHSLVSYTVDGQKFFNLLFLLIIISFPILLHNTKKL
jgi:hypothetical protein